MRGTATIGGGCDLLQQSFLPICRLHVEQRAGALGRNGAQAGAKNITAFADESGVKHIVQHVRRVHPHQRRFRGVGRSQRERDMGPFVDPALENVHPKIAVFSGEIALPDFLDETFAP